jgi:hypothetical protein
MIGIGQNLFSVVSNCWQSLSADSNNVSLCLDIEEFPSLLIRNEWSAGIKSHPTPHVKTLSFFKIYVLKFDKTWLQGGV